MPTSNASARPVPDPADWLRSRQWSDQHAALQSRIAENENKSKVIDRKAERASQASATAIEETAQLRAELDAFMDNRERDQLVSNTLNAHNQEIEGLKKGANDWRVSFRSCQRDMDEVEKGFEERMRGFDDELANLKRRNAAATVEQLSERLTEVESRNRRFAEILPQFSDMQQTVDSLVQTCRDQAAQITGLKSALAENQKAVSMALISHKTAGKQPSSYRGASLTGSHGARGSSTIRSDSRQLIGNTIDEAAMDQLHQSPTRQNAGQRQCSSTLHLELSHDNAGQAREYQEEAQILKTVQPLEDDSRSNASSDLDLPVLPPRKPVYEQSSSRKKQKLHHESEFHANTAKFLHQMMLPVNFSFDTQPVDRSLTKTPVTETRDVNANISVPISRNMNVSIPIHKSATTDSPTAVNTGAARVSSSSTCVQHALPKNPDPPARPDARSISSSNDAANVIGPSIQTPQLEPLKKLRVAKATKAAKPKTQKTVKKPAQTKPAPRTAVKPPSKTLIVPPTGRITRSGRCSTFRMLDNQGRAKSIRPMEVHSHQADQPFMATPPVQKVGSSSTLDGG